MDSIEEWARKRHEKLGTAAYVAVNKYIGSQLEWQDIKNGKTPPASVIRRYEIWKRKQLRTQNGH